MKESYMKGVASHHSPESCLDGPQGRGEALTGDEKKEGQAPIVCIGTAVNFKF